jgi:hypothetical protein
MVSLRLIFNAHAEPCICSYAFLTSRISELDLA